MIILKLTDIYDCYFRFRMLDCYGNDLTMFIPFNSEMSILENKCYFFNYTFNRNLFSYVFISEIFAILNILMFLNIIIVIEVFLLRYERIYLQILHFNLKFGLKNDDQST